jgi:hypothetical protein
VSEDRAPYDPYDIGNDDKIRTSVVQNDRGDCIVIEHDIARKKDRRVATFHAQTREVTVQNGEKAIRDLSQVRAMIFAQAMEALVNRGEVDLG